MAEDFNASTSQACGCDSPRLFPEFEPATYEAWYKEAVASLKGAPFEKKVITKTYEGIDLQPIYWAKDVEDLPQRGSLPGYPGYVRGTGYGGYVLKPWDICQEIACGTPEEFNEVATHDLARGQNALKLVLDTPSRKGLDPDSRDGDNGVGKNGLSLSTLEDLGTALRGIDLRTTPLMIHAGAMALPIVVLLAANLQYQNESLSHIRCCVGGDPLEELAREGKLSIDLSTAYDTMATLVAWSKDHAPHLQSILVHGSPYHDAGGSAVQELAYVIATGVEYIREMDKRGLSIDAVAPRMRFVFSLGPNFFMEIAKLKAARLLWAQIVQVFGGGDEAQKMCIHGRTSSYTKTVYDPYVNILRNTTEAFAGAMGGVDSMHVCSFDEPIRPADEFSRRVSRNMQIVLQEEAHFVHPIDPAGGAWYIEKLTDSVARKAWEIFQDIEAKGGMTQALMEGKPQKAVAEVAAKKAKSIDTRKDVMVGINMYPNLKEVPLAVPAVDHKALQEQRAKTVQSRRLRSDLFKLYDQLGEFHIPKNIKSLPLRTHSQTSGWSLTEQDPYNNVARTCIEAHAAALGHTQSLHTNSLDEAIALPTDFSARIARNTQLFLQDETFICKVVDPWGGSYYLESLTHDITHKAWALIQEVESLGGMAKAIETGLPKMRIEEAAARRQARIDAQKEIIVGVNKYRPDREDPMDLLEVDNTAVRESQIKRLQRLKAERDESKARACLNAITQAAETGEGNLLGLSVEAAKARCTLGEISDAMEKVFGRHKAIIRSISGVYSTEFGEEHEVTVVKKMADEFEAREGRRPRIMVAKMGQDGHDRGAKVVATAFADLGFDVDVGQLFQTPEEAAAQAVENDVHAIGMSSLAAGHKVLLPAMVKELKRMGREDIVVIAGGVIPPQDYDFLREHGASLIFGPGTVIPVAAQKVLEEINRRLN